MDNDLVFRVYINTENDAFRDNEQYEVARILRDIAARIEQQGLNPFRNKLNDANGNFVGFYSYRSLSDWMKLVCT